MKKFWLLISFLLIFCITFSKAGYSDEYPESYSWAFKNWITTQPTIEKANMYWTITRIELSKMISNYAINILKKNPDTSKKCQFSDISDRLNSQYDSWVTKACQLWLMWQWISNFRPYNNVTRAEFGTILSRLLYWNKYDWWTPYYNKHINNLRIRWIMTNISNPKEWMESRGNVMVMLKRSQELWDYKTPTLEELNGAAFQCNFCYLDGCFDEDIDKKWFIIPYNEWYIWYSWDYLYDATLNITYRKVDNPCEIAYEINVFHYNGCTLDYRYSDKKVESFNSKEKDRRKCMADAEKYFYNLIIWWEKDEIFTLWMDSFKKNIDNNSFFRDWSSKIYECEKNIRWENYKGVDMQNFMTETTFDADWYLEAIKKNNIKEAEIWYSCIKETLKS